MRVLSTIDVAVFSSHSTVRSCATGSDRDCICAHNKYMGSECVENKLICNTEGLCLPIHSETVYDDTEIQ